MGGVDPVLYNEVLIKVCYLEGEHIPYRNNKDGRKLTPFSSFDMDGILCLVV